jgi:hypothetical protein
MYTPDVTELLSRQIGGALTNVTVEYFTKNLKHVHEPTSWFDTKNDHAGKRPAESFCFALCSFPRFVYVTAD